MKTAVNKELERQRNEKRIGAGLGAEVTLYCDAPLQALLAQLEDELRFVLIVSQARLRPLGDAQDAAETELAGLRLQITPSPHAKCVRCWHHRPDIGVHAEHPELCGRCVENIVGNGEIRHHA